MTPPVIIRASELKRALPNEHGGRVIVLDYTCGDGPQQAINRPLRVTLTLPEIARVLEAIPESRLDEDAYAAARTLAHYLRTHR